MLLLVLDYYLECPNRILKLAGIVLPSGPRLARRVSLLCKIMTESLQQPVTMLEDLRDLLVSQVRRLCSLVLGWIFIFFGPISLNQCLKALKELV